MIKKLEVGSKDLKMQLDNVNRRITEMQTLLRASGNKTLRDGYIRQLEQLVHTRTDIIERINKSPKK